MNNQLSALSELLLNEEVYVECKKISENILSKYTSSEAERAAAYCIRIIELMIDSLVKNNFTEFTSYQKF